MSARACARAQVVALVLGLLAATGIAPNARAHDTPYSFIDLRLTGERLEGRVMAHVDDLAHEAGFTAPESLLSRSWAAARLGALHAVLERRMGVESRGRPIRVEWRSFEPVPDRQLLAFTWHSTEASSGIDVLGPMFPYDPLHETFVNGYRDGVLVVQEVLDHRRARVRVLEAARQPLGEVVRTFVIQGIHHIFIGPDHILFIVALLLLGGTLARLMKIVTAFTIAHSITLALATFQILNPSPRVIEPAIALSIMCVGVENLVAQRRARDVRAMLAFAFGFIHGFGFASVLREFGLPREALGAALASFNVGVEIGQACIVLAVAPVLAFARNRSPRAGRWIVGAGSAAVIVAGGYWLVQRVFFSA